MILPVMAMMIATQRPEVPPVCETVSVMENSGNGPNYKIKLCGNRALPIHTLIVDGATFPEKNVTYKVVTFWNG